MSECQTLASEKGGSQGEHGEKRVDSTLKAGSKVREGKESLPRSKRKQQQVSGRKSSIGGVAESWFHYKPGQT